MFPVVFRRAVDARCYRPAGILWGDARTIDVRKDRMAMVDHTSGARADLQN